MVGWSPQSPSVEDSHRVYEPWATHPPSLRRHPRRIHPGAKEVKVRPLMSVGVAPPSTHQSALVPSSAWKISHSRATLQQISHSEVSNSSNVPTPKSREQFAPLHQFLKRESGGSVGKYMRENASRSPLPCSAAPCWETTLTMLSQSLGSRQRKKTPHTKDFKKIVRR